MYGGAWGCWFSRTQKYVTLSTTEAEYVALGDAVNESLFLKHVWRFVLPGKRTLFRCSRTTRALSNLRRTS